MSTYRPQRWGSKSKALVVYRGTPYKNKRRRAALATAVKSVLNGRTGGFVGLEKKFFDCNLNGSALSAPTDAAGAERDPTTLDCLNCPAQGDGESQRDGRQISMDSITIKGQISIATQTGQTSLDTMPDIFIALVLDKQTNAAQLDSEDVFTNPSGLSGLASQPFRNLEYAARFRVLKTVRITARDFAGAIQPAYSGSAIEQQGATVPWSIYVNLKGMKVNFLSGQTTSVVDAIADKSLHLIAYASAISMAPVIRYNSRLRFKG